jgi:hypothetical protein
MMKMPEPMTRPTTMAKAEIGPSTGARRGISGVGALGEVDIAA